MSLIQIRGLRPLEGELKIQGSKNAALPIMAASILHPGVTRLFNVPDIQDVNRMMDILNHLGCNCRRKLDEVVIDASRMDRVTIPERYMKSMRSSVIVMGALLGRMGEAWAGTPGGCSIGARPIDLHLYALECLGAKVEEADGRIHASSSSLTGGDISFPFPSVGATEQALLASVVASGRTKIEGAAKEPEIESLCQFLSQMGARIQGIGTGTLLVDGIPGGTLPGLHGGAFSVPGDRIVAGTYLMAAMAAGGHVRLSGICPDHLSAVLEQMARMGAGIKADRDSIWAVMEGRPSAGQIETLPYPGFPTDLQSPMMAVMAVSEGESRVRETIFERRYEAASQLSKLGARIELEGADACIIGGCPLKGQEVEAPDLRGGAALVVAALAAKGVTTIRHCEHIHRGYEDICRDLRALGAQAWEPSLSGEEERLTASG